MQDRLLPLPAVLDRVGIKKTKLYAMVGAGEFPAPKKIGRKPVWRESAVDAWIAA
jgi:prophage regulatory protein